MNEIPQMHRTALEKIGRDESLEKRILVLDFNPAKTLTLAMVVEDRNLAREIAHRIGASKVTLKKMASRELEAEVERLYRLLGNGHSNGVAHDTSSNGHSNGVAAPLHTFEDALTAPNGAADAAEREAAEQRKNLQEAAIQILPSELAFRYYLCPISFDKSTGILTVEVPKDKATDKLAELIKGETRVSQVHMIEQAVETISSKLATLYAKRQTAAPDIQRMLDEIIAEAIKLHAADIFIDPVAEGNNYLGGQVRLAVDGELRPSEKYFDIDLRTLQRLVGVIRNKARVAPTDENLPGDGRYEADVQGRRVDLRVSTIPMGTEFQRIVMRILSSTLALRSLITLGMSEIILDKFRTAIQRPAAFVTIAGPTGEGKTTSAYALIKELLDLIRLNVCSLENPIECFIKGLVQIPINADAATAEKTGQMTFADALRSLLRQYPHFVFLGEIRDDETMKESVRAATTGISLLSTVHAYDAIRTFNRLKNLGATDFDISQSLTAATSQRLVKKLCENCKERATKLSDLGKRVASLYSIELTGEVFQARRGGCPQCQHAGYQDRIGAFEILELTPPVRDAVEKGLGPNEIAHVAVEEGYRPMVVAAMQHLANGLTDEHAICEKLAYDDAIRYVKPGTSHVKNHESQRPRQSDPTAPSHDGDSPLQL